MFLIIFHFHFSPHLHVKSSITYILRVSETVKQPENTAVLRLFAVWAPLIGPLCVLLCVCLIALPSASVPWRCCRLCKNHSAVWYPAVLLTRLLGWVSSLIFFLFSLSLWPAPPSFPASILYINKQTVTFLTLSYECHTTLLSSQLQSQINICILTLCEIYV